MKKRVIYLILFMLLIFPGVTYANEKKEVEFKSCIDGDTARFIMDKEEIKVRFLAIDTPETNHPKKGEEPYGKEAKEFLRHAEEAERNFKGFKNIEEHPFCVMARSILEKAGMR